MLKNTIQFSVFFILCIVLVSQVSALTLYVNKTSSSCSDSKNRTTNTRSLPWCTIQKFWTNATSGDTLCIGQGRYTVTSTPFTISNLKPTSRITIKGCGNANPILENHGIISSCINKSIGGRIVFNCSYSASATYGFVFNNLTNASIFSFEDIKATYTNYTITGTYWDNTNDRIYLQFPNQTKTNKYIYANLFVSRDDVFDISGIGGKGLLLANFTVRGGQNSIHITGSSNNTVIDTITFLGGRFPVRFAVDVRNNTVKNCTFKQYKGNNNWTWDNQKYDGLMENSAVYFDNALEGNKVIKNKIQGYFNGISMSVTSSGKLSGLNLSNNKISNVDDDGIEIEDFCNGATISYNSIINSTAGISLSPANASQARCRLYNNILVQNKPILSKTNVYYYGKCFKVDISHNATWNIVLDHNTCIGKGIDGGTYKQIFHNVNVTNNIFYTNSTMGRVFDHTGLGKDNVRYDYNVYFSKDGGNLFRYWNSDSNTTNYVSLAAARASALWQGYFDNHSINSNPLFQNINSGDYTPASNSPSCTMSTTGSYVGALSCSCLNPIGDANLTKNTTLCRGKYNLEGSADGVFAIKANGVTLDCNEATFIGAGDSTSRFIYISGYKNFTLKNCNIAKYGTGIYISSSKNIIVSNSTMTNCSQGIYTYKSVNISAVNNKYINDTYGCYITAMTNNTLIKSSIFKNCSKRAIESVQSFRTKVISNIISGVNPNKNTVGLYFYLYGNHHKIFNNTINGYETGIYMDRNSSLSNITQNTLSNQKTISLLTGYGIVAKKNASNLIIANNIISNSSHNGITTFTNRNTVSGNYIENVAHHYLDCYNNGRNYNHWFNNTLIRTSSAYPYNESDHMIWIGNCSRMEVYKNTLIDNFGSKVRYGITTSGYNAINNHIYNNTINISNMSCIIDTGRNTTFEYNVLNCKNQYRIYGIGKARHDEVGIFKYNSYSYPLVQYKLTNDFVNVTFLEASKPTILNLTSHSATLFLDYTGIKNLTIINNTVTIKSFTSPYNCIYNGSNIIGCPIIPYQINIAPNENYQIRGSICDYFSDTTITDTRLNCQNFNIGTAHIYLVNSTLNATNIDGEIGASIDFDSNSNWVN